MLGTFLAFGMTLSAVEAASMPVKMTMSSGMDGAGHCKDCGDKDAGGKAMGSCSLGCAAPVLAVIQQSLPTKLVLVVAALPQQDSLLLGQAFSPDPGPPRSHDIG